jgi:hypothetical protein
VGRLIFVEGFPGAGKSTTAQFLARQLARRGEAARWVYEQEEPHPLVPPRPPGGYRSWDTFADVRVARWRAFTTAAAPTAATVIPESALLQLPVAAMLTRNVEPERIAALVRRLAEVVVPLRPALVYLARRDPAAAFRALDERRGVSWLLWHVQASAGSPSRRRAGCQAWTGFSRTGGRTRKSAGRSSRRSRCQPSCSTWTTTAGPRAAGASASSSTCRARTIRPRARPTSRG